MFGASLGYFLQWSANYLPIAGALLRIAFDIGQFRAHFV